jgi:dienelactone hydrolase
MFEFNNVEKVCEPNLNGYHIVGEKVYKGTLILFGGSEGSSMYDVANRLAYEGIEVYPMYYFGRENLPDKLSVIPLEFFEKVLAYVNRTRVAKGDITVIGASKGAELALVLATIYKEIDKVILVSPSSYVFQGLDYMNVKSSWKYNGIELPYIPNSSASPIEIIKIILFSPIVNRFRDIYPFLKCYKSMIKNYKRIEETRIQVENFKGKILMICSGKDEVWPACEMADVICKYHNNTQIQTYPEATHIVLKCFTEGFSCTESEMKIDEDILKGVIEFI